MVALSRRLFPGSGGESRGGEPAPESAVGAFGALPGDLRREVAAFDRQIVRVGWCEQPAELARDREAWRPILDEVKARRRRGLAIAAHHRGELAALPPAALEAMLLRGWHLVFHCYGVAAGLLYPEDEEGEAVKRRELQAAYCQARRRLTEARDAGL